MSDTPETDDIARGNHVVPTEWAQQLERERDEARDDAQKSKAYKRVLKETNLRQTERIRYLEGATNHACGTPLSVALRERDEAITTIEDAKRALKATDYEGILLAAMRVKEERDEAREEVRLLKAILDLIKKDAFCLSQLSDCIEDDKQ